MAELRQFTQSMMDLVSNLSCEVDGAPIPHLQDRFRIQSSAFSFTLPNDNYFSAVYGTNFPAGSYFPAVDDGVFVMLSPLPPGAHTLHFHGYIAVFDFALDVTYLLNVAK